MRPESAVAPPFLHGTRIAHGFDRSKDMGTVANHVGPPIEDPHAALERALIAEFLGDLGHTLQSIDALPPEQRRAVLRYAAAYATLRLSEIEARARYIAEIDAS
jgi:hypothetical protein